MSIKSSILFGLAALVFLGVVGLVSASRSHADEEDAQKRTALESAKVTLTEAITAAEKEIADGKVVDAEVDIVDGKASYAVEIDKDGVQTVLVDLDTGNVLKVVTGEMIDSGSEGDEDEDDE